MRVEFDENKFEEISIAVVEGNMTNELSTVSSYIAFYGHQEQLWIEAHDSLKYQGERRAAEVIMDHRTNFAKPTKETGDAAVLLDEQYDKIQRAFLKSKAQKGKYSAAVNSLEARLKALQSMNSNKRSELNSYGGLNGIPTTGIAGSPVYHAGYISTTNANISSVAEATSIKMDDDKRKAIAEMLAKIEAGKPAA